MAVWTGIKACVFDAYGTLFDIHAPAAAIAGELGEKARSLSDMWRQKQLQYTWLRSLMGEYADFEQVTGDGLDYALAAHGVDDADIRARLMEMYMRLDAYPDAVSTLEALKGAGYATAILSNGSPKMLSAAAGSSGLAPLLDAVLSVDELGVYKPDRRIYQLAVDRMKAAPEEICFVSANAWDCAGGANFGFRNVHINRFGQPPERLPGEPRVIMTSLSELLPLLA